MKDETRFFLTVAAAGLLVGLLGYAFLQGSGDSGYCLELEEQFRQNISFNGSISCRPPGVFNVNVSDQIENRTRLKCVCRRGFNGMESYFAVTVPR